MGVVLILIVVLSVLLFAEYLARSTTIHTELTRKLVHMAVGTFVAFWPFFISWRQIEMLSVAFLVVIALSIRLQIFTSIHTVPRKTVGELMFAMVIGFLALISSSKWIFMVAMLQLSIGDGLAAIIGLGWGDGNQYKVFGRTKSIAGTAAFAAVSLLTVLIYLLGSGVPASIATLLGVPIAATVAENVAVNGTDNLVVPLVVALLLGGST